MAANPIPELSDTDKARFWAKVDVRGPDECWLWQGGVNGRGYGNFSISHHTYSAHRVAIAIDGRGVVGLIGRHKCDVRRCCNPEHLETGSTADNINDMVSRGRDVRGDDHYSRKHPEKLARGERNGKYTKPENTPRGERHGLAKLNAETVRAIRADTRTQSAIAADYGIDRSNISAIQRRKTWAHVI